MKTKLLLPLLLLLLSTLNSQLATAHAQGTAFTYQGRLNDGANPANGIYDLRFAIYDAVSAGVQQGSLLTNSATAVSNGLFTVTLDFGNQFPGTARWLEIAVRTNGGGAFNTLTPRQALTPTPYAIFAGGANAAGLTGNIPATSINGTYGSAVSFNNGANSFNGSFYGQFFGSSFVGGNFVGSFIGSGAGLADVWHTGGNLGTTAGVNFLGTTDNQPLQLHVNSTRALRLEPTLNDGGHFSIVNVIGGSPNNSVSNGVYGATIGGGGANFYFGFPARNSVTKDFGTVGGGFGNTASGNNATVGGGDGNTASELEATIGGGHQNISSGGASTVGGGFLNVSSNSSSTVAGGAYNLAGGQEAAVGGGYANAALAGYAVIAGGYYNTNNGYISILGGGYQNLIQSNADYTFIGGGGNNTLGAGTTASVIVGGVGNIMQSLSGFSFIGGGNGNVIGTNNGTAVIVGGLVNTIGNFSDRAAIVGGNGNAIQNNSLAAFIGGGIGNTIGVGSYDATIGGGGGSSIQSNSYYSVIGGGGANTIGTNSNSALIAGGYFNGIGSFSDRATVVGGNGNFILNNSGGSFIGGGVGNTIGNNSIVSTIAGGNFNYILNNTAQAVIGGGLSNTNGGFAAAVPGGVYNVAAGAYSFAAGQRAKATNDGTFVWADSQAADFSSTTTNQFNVRANGGVRLVTDGAGITLDGQPLLGSGNFIQNQTAAPQSASFRINGSMTAASFNINGSGSISGTASVNSLNLTNTLRVPGAGIGTGTPAFIHRATGANIVTGATHQTVITHPLCDGDPNAILIITHNYSPSSIIDTHPTSVFYNGSKWAIYHDDFVAMTTNSAWNVLIIKP